MSLVDLFLQAIGKRSDRILTLNKEQLLISTRADGRLLPTLSPVTIEEFGKENETGRVDLLDTGAFQGAFFLAKAGEEIIIGSTDSKAEMLETTYGDEIYGLTEKNQGLVFDEISKELSVEVNKKVNQVLNLASTALFKR